MSKWVISGAPIFALVLASCSSRGGGAASTSEPATDSERPGSQAASVQAGPTPAPAAEVSAEVNTADESRDKAAVCHRPGYEIATQVGRPDPNLANQVGRPDRNAGRQT